MSKVDDIFADMEPTQAPAVPAAPQPLAQNNAVPTTQPAPQQQSQGSYWKPQLPETPKKTPSKKWVLFTVIGIVVIGLLGGGYFAWSRGIFKDLFNNKNMNAATSLANNANTNSSTPLCVINDEIAATITALDETLDEGERCATAQLLTLVTLRNALDTYRDGISPIPGVGTFPSTLDALVPELNRQLAACDEAERQRQERDGITGLPFSCPTYETMLDSLSTTDVYTQQPYPYTPTDGDYRLTYEFRYYAGISDTIKAEFKDGDNTITSNNSSDILDIDDDTTTNSTTNSVNSNTNTAILDTTTDTDVDGITDYEETNIYGTMLNLKDSDSDGFDDKTEICGGYNPSGSGRSTTAFAAPASGCPQ